MSGWWSLACCKHDMRTARPFRAKAIDLSVPSYVFTLASLDPDIGQALVSVAQVTEHCFDTMDEIRTIPSESARRDSHFISANSCPAKSNRWVGDLATVMPISAVTLGNLIGDMSTMLTDHGKRHQWQTYDLGFRPFSFMAKAHFCSNAHAKAKPLWQEHRLYRPAQLSKMSTAC